MSLEEFNLLRQRIASLIRGPEEPAFHEVRFDDAGLPSGVYVYRLRAHPLTLEGTGRDFVQSRRLVVVR